jgi:hypothetical protein
MTTITRRRFRYLGGIPGPAAKGSRLTFYEDQKYGYWDNGWPSLYRLDEMADGEWEEIE